VNAVANAQAVAVVTRTWALADRLAKYLPKGSIRLDHDLSTWQSGPGVYYGTFHGAKGLEFDTVILPFCSPEVLPDPEVVRTLGVAEAEAADGKLLYVGVTRAKTGLIITYTGTRTSLLPSTSGLYQLAKA
jgi:superfamily I DNA/RNA helicase